MHLSIVIPAYNEAKLLPRTLEIAAAGRRVLTELGLSTELIVCDNNSTDETSALATQGGARVVHEPVNQIGRARNTGATAASGEWLLFLDADSSPSAELWRDLAAATQEAAVIGGGSTLCHDGHFPMLTFALTSWNAWSRLSGEAAGAFLFCRREAFEKLGGFSTVLFAGEEVEFCRRLKRLARPQKQRMKILHEHPLLTSPRKAELYRPGEFFRFILRTVLRRGKTLERREDCAIWYDGRR